MSDAEKSPMKIAVLISGNGSNLQAIIEHQQQSKNLYEIVLVISNRPEAFGLKRAQKAGIATKVIDHTNFTGREAFDEQMKIELDKAEVELVVLAGFMRILSAEFTEHFLGRMLNIHPSLLPKYQGLNTHQRALDSGDKEHGLSVHFVTPELDGGPVIVQSKTNIQNDDTAESLQQRIHSLEHTAYPTVVEWFAQGRLLFKQSKVYFDAKELNSPIILTSENSNA